MIIKTASEIISRWWHVYWILSFFPNNEDAICMSLGEFVKCKLISGGTLEEVTKTSKNSKVVWKSISTHLCFQGKSTTTNPVTVLEFCEFDESAFVIMFPTSREKKFQTIQNSLE